MRTVRRLAPIALAVSLTLVCTAPAVAGHQQGGFFTAEVSAQGRLAGSLVYLEAGTCTVGQAAANSFTLTNPSGAGASIATSGTYTRCLANSRTSRTTFDVDLAATFGSAPDGTYGLTFSSCCRVGGITNMTGSGTRFESRVTKVDGQASGAPNLSSDVALGIAKGYLYSQSLNASDPDGGPLTYTSRAGQADGPDWDLVGFSSTGVVSVPASTTSTLAHGARYVYKVRVSDDEGDYSERDVLLTVTGQNAPPTISGLADAEVLTVAPGQVREIQLSASDPNNASPKIDTVSILAFGLPAWATLTTTPGNPAQATLRLAPPAGTSLGTLSVNIDAADDDSVAVLTASVNVGLRVESPPPAAPVIVQAPSALSSASTFAFRGEDGVTFSCSLDGAPFAQCPSPLTLSGIGDGAHTLRVRAVDAGGGESSIVEHSWTLDTTAPGPPVVVGGPLGAGNASDATFEFQGEPGASFECRLDAGDWAPCESPLRLSGLTAGAHELAVRQVDAAGNRSEPLASAWSVGGAADVPTPTPTPSPSRVVPTLRVSPIVASTITVRGTTATVGCMVTGGSLRSCVVRAYVPAAGRSGTRGSASRLRQIGSGRVAYSRPGTGRAAVRIRLSRLGRRLVRRAGGVRVLLKVVATPIDGSTARAQRSTRFLPERLVVVPAEGLFATDGASPLPRSRAYLRSLVRRLGGNVRVLRCAGHTDSTGAASYNARLGLRRAAAVCAQLRRYGARARTEVRTRGESAPRASNGTAAGRALNRRVELTVVYR